MLPSYFTHWFLRCKFRLPEKFNKLMNDRCPELLCVTKAGLGARKWEKALDTAFKSRALVDVLRTPCLLLPANCG